MAKSETEQENENEMKMKMKMKNGLKNPWEVVDDDHDRKLQVWPDWLPSDWYICRNIDHPHSSSSSHPHVYYSNPKGKKFYSKEEVLHYVSTHRSKKKVSKQIRMRKITKLEENHNKAEEKEIGVEKHNGPQEVAVARSLTKTVWPDWLPDDWHIDRSYDNPTDVSYCSPKWKKFRSKDEVLHYLAAQSKKASKQTRKRITKVKDNIPKKLVQSETVTKTHKTRS